MEELPEKNTPPSLPEEQEPSAEDASAVGAGQQPPQEPASGSEATSSAAETRAEESPAQDASPEEAPAATAADSGSPSAADRVEEALGEAPAKTGESAHEASAPEAQPVPPAQPERVESEAALQAEGAEAETPAEAAQPESRPAPETGTPAAAQTDSPEASAEGEQPNLDELQLTPSGAVMVPGEEAPRSEEPRPRKGPGREEKPSGPRIAELRPGQVVEGTVSRIEKYGAFVNLGLVERRDGLIHISELAPYRIRRVEDVVQVGAPVRARVVSVDLGRGRIALSLNDVDEGSAKEATAGPSEPALTSMAMAFQEAQSRQRDSQRSNASAEGRVGDKKRREQEDLMRRLRGENG